MPSNKAPARTSQPSSRPVRDAADALYRAAKESCHQHQRLSFVLGLGVDDAELEGVAEVAAHCDRILEAQTARYETVAAVGRGKETEELWRAANNLWMACREYCRRHAQGDVAATRLKRHSAAQFGELTVEYELEMSARLALKQTLSAYAELRPDVAERRAVARG